jgi:protein SCO1/2
MTMPGDLFGVFFKRRSSILYQRHAIFDVLGAILCCWLSTPAVAGPAASSQLPPTLGEVAFEQRLNEQVPADLLFRDETGRTVRLGEYFGDQPVILTLAYYSCPMLCSMVLESLSQSLRALSFNIGEQFVVVTVSFDARDTPESAAARKAQILQHYTRPGGTEGWHFLTGDEASIRQLTQAVGFRYAYEAETEQFAHATGLVVLTPQGQIARYLYGLEFAPKALRLALVEADAGQIASAVDQLLLFCYKYDPTTGKYGLVIMNVLRLAGLTTVAALGGFMFVMFGRDRKRVV